jgi:phosphoglycerate dehydrogenase-like enzyme
MTTYRAMIASPLELEHIERIRASVPASVEIIYVPELYPPTRYVADHHGPPDFRRTDEQQKRWLALAATADFAFEFPDGNRHPRDYAPNLRWVQTTSSGIGQMLVRMGIKQGDLIVTNARGIHARPLAEFVFFVLLSAVKEAGRNRDEQRRHHWERYCGDELSGKTLAIVGPGMVGQEIARIARAFDMTPVALGRDTRSERAKELGVDRLYPRSELISMLRAADALVLCAPHTPETENMLSRAEFDALKPGVIFVNIGRGPLVDEAILLEKLRDGTIKLAGLDVFRTEPLPADSPFWDEPNVIVSPHSASTSTRENERLVEIFIHNLSCMLENRQDEMQNIFDIERMY